MYKHMEPQHPAFHRTLLGLVGSLYVPLQGFPPGPVSAEHTAFCSSNMLNGATSERKSR